MSQWSYESQEEADFWQEPPGPEPEPDFDPNQEPPQEEQEEQ